MNDNTEMAGKSDWKSLGDREMRLEDTAIARTSRGLSGAHRRHPALFVLAAFILGGVLTSFFTISSYRAWTTESVNLLGAMLHVLLYPIAGGVLFAILAVVCARSLRA